MIITTQIFLESAEELRKLLQLNENIDPYLIGLAFLAKRQTLEKSLKGILEKKYGMINYEILEFLGDSVLHFIIRNYLVLTYGHLGPGNLTTISTQIESNAFFLCLMNNNNLCSRFIGISKESAMKTKHPLCADSFEALAGVLYYYYTYIINDRNLALKKIEDWLFNFWNIGKFIEEVRLSGTYICSKGEEIKLGEQEKITCASMKEEERFNCINNTGKLDLEEFMTIDDRGIITYSIYLNYNKTSIELATVKGMMKEEIIPIAEEIAYEKLRELELV